MQTAAKNNIKKKIPFLRRKILLVEDSRTFQNIFKATLSEDDCELFVCSNGEDALKLISSQYVDFVCASYYLPDIGGIELCRRVRDLTQHAPKPFVLIASGDSTNDLVDALPAGVTDVFRRKDIDQLLAFIKRFPSAHTRIFGRVLYVEDERSQRLILKAILENRGLVVDAFSSAEAALLQFHENDYDLVLTDIVLEGTMSGVALANQIRRRTDSKGDIPIIAVTAFNDPTRRLELYNLGVTDYILKPIAENELLVRISSLLENRRLLAKVEFDLQQHHNEELARSDSRFEALFVNSTEAIAMYEMIYGADGFPVDFRTIKVNPFFEKHTGLTVNQVLGKLSGEIYGSIDSLLLNTFVRVIETGKPEEFEYYFAPKQRQFHIQAFALEGRFFATMCDDITERKLIEDRLRESSVAFETHEAIVITDVNANIIRVNKAFQDITGYSSEDVLGKNPRIFGSGRQDRKFYEDMWQQLLTHGTWSGEIWDKRKSGQIYPKWLTITAVKDNTEKITAYVAIFSDITERKKADEEIHNLAFYDALTHLPNRRLLIDRLRSALSTTARNHQYGAILFLDLDRFKTINDTLGHDYGDLLLIEVAQRIQSCIREVDTVARLGGDEFVVLLEEIDENTEEASRKVAMIAEKIRVALTLPYQLNGNEQHSSPSIGVCLYLGNKESADTLLKHADMAMYQVKDNGRNAVRFFDPAMQLAVETRAALEADLRHAVPDRQLQLHYQIQVDNELRPIGAEALIRWIHPTRGMISPIKFIPIAEESSLILELGDWVLDTACSQLGVWASSEKTRHLTLAVNVSAQQFKQHDFVEKVSSVLRMHEVLPSSLKLELTESVVLNDVADIVTKMHALKALGVMLSMDDFGTGYSSLSYLKQLPLDQIKIDQSFVRDMTTDPNDAVMVKTIIDLAINFRLNVIAEGVEVEAQLVMLKKYDCMAYQGYFFSKPVPIEQFEVLLEQS
ncbi:MAG: EAL domain-containing protein [Proteobacteria bacterium]|nr:EAL domain-containing protein [Pseudomonadota bacterium]